MKNVILRTSMGLKFIYVFATILSVLVFNLNSKAQTDKIKKVHGAIADWEKQESVWVIWPHEADEQKVVVECIRNLVLEVPVTLVVPNDSLRDYALLDLKKDSIDLGKIKILIIPGAKGYVRDHGPWFMFDQKGYAARASFKWSNFGLPVIATRGITKRDSMSMGNFAEAATSKLKVHAINSDLVIENGMIDINSKGVAICFMETILQRNPTMDLPSITNEMKRVLGLKKIIWLGSSPTMEKVGLGPKASNIFGYGANGHIDQFFRFANDTTILVALHDGVERRFDPVTSADFMILEENIKYLRNSTDENDRPFHIIEIPVPVMRYHMIEDSIPDVSVDTIRYKEFENGTIIYNAPMATYLNYFVCNNLVLVPEYFKETLTESEKIKDEQVGKIFSNLYPGKKIIRINPLALNLKGAGIRRAFIGQPEGIQSVPYPGK
jgi:agmatine deiminase